MILRRMLDARRGVLLKKMVAAEALAAALALHLFLEMMEALLMMMKTLVHQGAATKSENGLKCFALVVFCFYRIILLLKLDLAVFLRF